jgi:hypothetical protein
MDDVIPRSGVRGGVPQRLFTPRILGRGVNDEHGAAALLERTQLEPGEVGVRGNQNKGSAPPKGQESAFAVQARADLTVSVLGLGAGHDLREYR